MSKKIDCEITKMFPAQEVPEHAIYLEFNDDDGAALFYEWWNQEGQELFNKYAKKEIKNGRFQV